MLILSPGVHCCSTVSFFSHRKILFILWSVITGSVFLGGDCWVLQISQLWQHSVPQSPHPFLLYNSMSSCINRNSSVSHSGVRKIIYYKYITIIKKNRTQKSSSNSICYNQKQSNLCFLRSEQKTKVKVLEIYLTIYRTVHSCSEQG